MWWFCSLPIQWVSGITALVSLQSSSVLTAMHCRSFRDDDILTCPEQFGSVYVLRTCIQASYASWCNLRIQFAERILLACCSAFANAAQETRRQRRLSRVAPLPPMKLGHAGNGEGIFGSFSLAYVASGLPSKKSTPPVGGDLTLSTSRLQGHGWQIWWLTTTISPKAHWRADLREHWERLNLWLCFRLLLGPC